MARPVQSEVVQHKSLNFRQISSLSLKKHLKSKQSQTALLGIKLENVGLAAIDTDVVVWQCHSGYDNEEYHRVWRIAGVWVYLQRHEGS